jgi:hypothetical protein
VLLPKKDNNSKSGEICVLGVSPTRFDKRNVKLALRVQVWTHEQAVRKNRFAVCAWTHDCVDQWDCVRPLGVFGSIADKPLSLRFAQNSTLGYMAVCLTIWIPAALRGRRWRDPRPALPMCNKPP